MKDTLKRTDSSPNTYVEDSHLLESVVGQYMKEVTLNSWYEILTSELDPEKLYNNPNTYTVGNYLLE